MEKRALLAVALSVLVLVAWTYFFAPQQPPPSPAPGDTTQHLEPADPEPGAWKASPAATSRASRSSVQSPSLRACNNSACADAM